MATLSCRRTKLVICREILNWLKLYWIVRSLNNWQQKSYSSSPHAMESNSVSPTILIAFTLLLSASLYDQRLVGATDYTVGNAEGWTYGLDYQTWAQQYNFTVSDSLMFSYIKGQHNVYQVVEDTFRSCDASSGVLNTYFSGNDRVNLTEAGKYWFLCNIKGHCRGGMRVGITVVSGSPGSSGSGDGRGSPPPPPLFPEFQPPPQPAAGGAPGAAKGRWLVLGGTWWALILI